MKARILRGCIFSILIALLGFFLISCRETPAERGIPNPEEISEKEATNIGIIKEYTEAIHNVDYEKFKEIIDPNAVWYYRGRKMPHTPENTRDIHAHWKSALPDQNYGIEIIFAKDDKVAVLFDFTGTHQGTLLGYPPTGNKISVGEMVIYRLENKRIVEHWVVFDEHLLRQQLSEKDVEN